ncbi:phosphatase PAP2 family protein [Thiohalocapsa halophila]
MADTTATGGDAAPAMTRRKARQDAHAVQHGRGWLDPWRARVGGIPVGWLILFLLFANLMLAYPGLDLAVAGLFYTPGDGFTALGQLWERLLYHSVEVLMIAGNLALVGVWLLNRRSGRRLLGLTGRKLALLLCLLALLPGLMVNQVLKEHWGRARPVQVAQLGGERAFTPAFVYTGGSGGAFSSGHVAAAAYVIAVAHLLRGPRSLWVVLAVIYTLLVALARMAAGGHFLSDAVTSVFLVLFGYMVLRRLVCGGTDSDGTKACD